MVRLTDLPVFIQFKTSRSTSKPKSYDPQTQVLPKHTDAVHFSVITALADCPCLMFAGDDPSGAKSKSTQWDRMNIGREVFTQQEGRICV